MRKVALLAAVVLSAAALNTSSPVVAQDVYSLNKNTFLFLQGPGGPAAAPAASAPGMRVAKKKKSKR